MTGKRESAIHLKSHGSRWEWLEYSKSSRDDLTFRIAVSRTFGISFLAITQTLCISAAQEILSGNCLIKRFKRFFMCRDACALRGRKKCINKYTKSQSLSNGLFKGYFTVLFLFINSRVIYSTKFNTYHALPIVR